MISSMTAFSRMQDSGHWGSAVWELRSVNHRYLEINVRLPDSLKELEQQVRETISKFLSRGKVDVTLKYVASAAMSGHVNLNKSMLSQLRTAMSELETEIGRAIHCDATRLLSWPGVLEEQSPDMSPVHQAVLALLKKALDSMVEMRIREGNATSEIISSRLSSVDEQVKSLRSILPELLKSQREQLLAKLSELKVEYDQDRFEHELVYLAQKADVEEELDRLETHVVEVKRSLTQNGSMGRRLDFLMQELNREANTLGSKASDTRVTMTAVELKVLIEQMREQVQNIE